jgi:hypothetical protein
MSTTQETLVIRYLLGELPSAEMAAIEKRFFTEPGFLDLVRVTEEQLIRDALAGDLSRDQQDKFQRHFLSFPDLRRKYEGTRALRDALALPVKERLPEPSIVAEGNSAKWRSPTVLMIAACLLLGLLVVDDSRLRLQVAGRKTSVVQFTLEPGLVRSGESKQVRLVVPPESLLVRIRIRAELAHRYASYDAVLRKVDSRQDILRVKGLVGRPGGSFQDVILEISASMLTGDSYLLTLEGDTPHGLEPVDTYSFDVVHGPAR